MYKIIKICVVLMLITSCGKSSKLPKDTLIVGISAEPVTLFPYGSNDSHSARVHVQIFDRLVSKTATGLYPALATDWKLLSPVILQMNLKPNVKFHNGEIFSAEDVKYSLERMLKSPEVLHIADPIKSVEIINSNLINIHLKAPFAPILAHLSHSVAAILNKKASVESGDSIDQIPVGTGPYKLETWNRGQNILLTRFDEYWGELAKIKNIEFRVIPEASARTITLETKDIDIAYDVDPVDRERIIANPNLNLIEESIARIEYFGFNIGKGKNSIWKDKRVREAIASAIDIDGIINSVLFGSATPADSIIYESVIGHYDGLQPRKQDLEKAKKILAEAGIKPGTKISMWTTAGQRQKILEVIQANLREIGIEASIEVFEWARFLDGTSKGEHDAFILGWTTVTGDADYGIYNLLHSSSWGGSGNRSFYSNPQIDRALELARVESNPIKRNELYKNIQKIVYEDIPFIPLFYKISSIGTTKNVTDFEFNPSDSHELKTVNFIEK